MLERLDECLETFFRAAAPLSATDVDVSFEPPDRTWSAKLTRPTVSLFLSDVRRSVSRSRSGSRVVERPTGVVHQHAAPVLELNYVVSTWASDHGDERALLSSLLRAVLGYGAVPREYLPADFELFDPPTLAIARADQVAPDVVHLLDGQLKPAVLLTVVTEFEVGAERPAGPPVEGIETAIGRIGSPAAPERRRRVAGEVTDPAAVGALVRSPGDATYVNAAGQFLLRAAEGDEIVIETDPPRVGRVPAVGGVRFGA